MKKFCIFVSVLILSGCVSFTGGNTPKKDFIEGIGSRPNIKLSLDIYSTTNNEKDSWRSFELKREIAPEIKNIFDSSNMFGEVGYKITNPDYELEIKIRDVYTECAPCNLLNAATLSIIPSWTNEKFLYEAKLKNAKTKETVSFEYFEKSENVRHILTLFALPFMYENEFNMHKNVVNNLVIDVSREMSR
ncbi:MAG: hypothetical protein LBR70_02600 [Lactobacillaceae bacterium]|jgi:hypothetical protein|nr:hypothetical protein [Lactobacillaceae bacterium]